MNKIAPSILSADFSNLDSVIKTLEEGKPDLMHLDIMDGHFVPNLTFGPIIAETVKKMTDIPIDAHLMVTNPDFLIPLFADAGCDIISVHVETCPNLHRSIQSIKQRGLKAGVAINPGTSISFLEYVLCDVDMVLIMSVNPGFGNQSYIPQVNGKIRKVRAMVNELGKDIDIQVDGGIKIDNIKSVADMGANVFVAGSAIVGDKDGKKPSEVIAEMRRELC